MTPATADQLPASPECTLATHPGYQHLRANCRQTRDVPLLDDSGQGASNSTAENRPGS